MLYMYTLMPLRAQIKLIFALRQAVSEIESIFIYTTLTWTWRDFERSSVILTAYMFYMFTLIPQKAQIKLLFALRQAVSEIEPIFIHAALMWPWKVKCNFGSIHALYVYTFTPEAQIKLRFALRQAVYEIDPIFIYATLTWPWCDLERSNVILAA